ncbi:unnamed protein product [Caenorhabditis sp. 36 PRJEB53466]|nr:unnamed protein product [Caenorhabditis sp. 36 PRJEB53466]
MKKTMLITLIVCLCLGTKAHSDNLEVANSSASSSAPNTPQRITKAFCDNDDELAKISCMSDSDHEQIWGGIVKHGLARVLNGLVIRDALVLIAKEELRKALNLPPPRPWAPYNSTKPSDAELASAPTIEAYFNLKEPRPKTHSLDSYYFYEHNFPPAIEFLNKRVPRFTDYSNDFSFRMSFEEEVRRIARRYSNPTLPRFSTMSEIVVVINHINGHIEVLEKTILTILEPIVSLVEELMNGNGTVSELQALF